MKNLVEEKGYTGIILGVRADEDSTRAKERYFSPRDKHGDWDFDFEKAIAIAPKCSFEGGNLASTLDKALTEIAKSTNQTLADYHVCNNNAALQAELFAGFKATSNVKACSAASRLCRGPKWLYNP